MRINVGWMRSFHFFPHLHRLLLLPPRPLSFPSICCLPLCLRVGVGMSTAASLGHPHHPKGGICDTHRTSMPPFDVASGSFRMARDSSPPWAVPTCPPPRSVHNPRTLSSTERVTTVWMHTRGLLRHRTSPLVDATRVATVLRTNVAIRRQTRHGQSLPNASRQLEQRRRCESEMRRKRCVLENARPTHRNGGCAQDVRERCLPIHTVAQCEDVRRDAKEKFRS